MCLICCVYRIETSVLIDCKKGLEIPWTFHTNVHVLWVQLELCLNSSVRCLFIPHMYSATQRVACRRLVGHELLASSPCPEELHHNVDYVTKHTVEFSWLFCFLFFVFRFIRIIFYFIIEKYFLFCKVIYKEAKFLDPKWLFS